MKTAVIMFVIGFGLVLYAVHRAANASRVSAPVKLTDQELEDLKREAQIMSIEETATPPGAGKFTLWTRCKSVN